MSSALSVGLLATMLLSVVLIALPRQLSWIVAHRLRHVTDKSYRKRAGKRGPGEVVYLWAGILGFCASIAVLLVSLSQRGELTLPRVMGALFVGVFFLAFSMALPQVSASTRVWFTSPESREGDALYDISYWGTRIAYIGMSVLFVWEILRG